jgi:hypothetical protein
MRKNIRIGFATVVMLLISALSFYAGRQSAPQMTVKLDNSRVTVTESITPVGGRREPYVRPTDQLLIFLDDAEYEAIESNGEKTLRKRKVGDVIWHSKGEQAPLLVNRGKAYRNLIVVPK